MKICVGWNAIIMIPYFVTERDIDVHIIFDGQYVFYGLLSK